MENLLRFLGKASSFLLFVFLQTIALFLLVSHNNYQQSVALSSANVVIGNLYDSVNSFTEYFHLRTNNTLLAEENTALKNANMLLLEQLQDTIQTQDTLILTADSSTTYSYITAKVINSSVNKQLNYITLDKGSLHGIQPDMGVVNSEGVVGIVSTVSENFSVVIPILNPRIQVSCRIAKNDYYGSLLWEGKNAEFANLKEIPQHVELVKGDTIVTSGFSAIFPENIIVGTVEEVNTAKDYNFSKIKVRLAVNFQTISFVNLIKFAKIEELNNLEKQNIE
ncbi:MAG: rod shape-determining protein MreC [Paludibacteraceae bacterium]|nr:rod shape-determining protein MreC [Paludibacteraceae bacterium]MBP6284345.1 rod shape-determining protein MreC [Paludibacteraceae bacterium]